MPPSSLTFLFDTETTSLITNTALPLHQQPRVIEFYGMLVNDQFLLVDELEFVCDPQIAITEEVTKITGISNADVEGKPKFSHYASHVAEMLRHAGEVVAHNLSYDKFVLDCEFARIGGSISWPARLLCTVEATEWFKGFRLNLSALHDHLFGEPFSGAHRAKQDVQAMARCFKQLREHGDI